MRHQVRQRLSWPQRERRNGSRADFAPSNAFSSALNLFRLSANAFLLLFTPAFWSFGRA
jgi:hypothetical protein